MHTALGTNKAAILNDVKRFADPIRHGNFSEFLPTNSADRFKILSITRDAIIRFKDHLLQAGNGV